MVENELLGPNAISVSFVVEFTSWDIRHPDFSKRSGCSLPQFFLLESVHFSRASREHRAIAGRRFTRYPNVHHSLSHPHTLPLSHTYGCDLVNETC